MRRGGCIGDGGRLPMEERGACRGDGGARVTGERGAMSPSAESWRRCLGRIRGRESIGSRSYSDLKSEARERVCLTEVVLKD